MKEDLKAVVGRKIRQFRRKAGLTIEELADRAQIHPNYLGDIERGRRNPALENLEKIAKGLNQPLSEVFSSIELAPPQLSKSRDKLSKYSAVEQSESFQALIKALAKNTEKDREYVIQSAKSLSLRLKNKH